MHKQLFAILNTLQQILVPNLETYQSLLCHWLVYIITFVNVVSLTMIFF